MSNHIPLAAQIRPASLTDFVGQEHLVGKGKPLYQAILNGKLHSMILWGPPGTGKTTLAKILASASDAQFISLSAVMSGLKDIREAIAKAQKERTDNQRGTVLFIDEVHRFNKGQQDAFLPFVEDGTVTFIGATTENPSFELNNALLSRARVYILKPLKETDILQIMERAILNLNEQLKVNICLDDVLREKIAKMADGDARQVLNLIELLVHHGRRQNKEQNQEQDRNQDKDQDQELTIDAEMVEKALTGSLRRFDKGGDEFYDQISALHKAVRGSSPDGALYWFARMIDGGCDPLYIARRVVRMASEDIGNADPKALEIALNAWDVQERLGSPEGELALAQAVVYMAVAPKSNAVYVAFKEAMQDAQNNGSLPVPIHIRNAPTKLMRSLGHGKEYRYDHDEDSAFAKGQTYFPDSMREKIYYHPVPRGLEIKIQEKLNKLRNLSVKLEPTEKS